MRKFTCSLSLVLFCLLPGLYAVPPTMPPDTYRTCIAELKAALKNNDVNAVKRQAANLKAYGLQGDGERIIQDALAENKNMRTQVKEGYSALVDLRDAASRKSIKACYTLITNLEKKFMSDMISTASGAVIGGGPIAEIRNAINDVQGNYDATKVLNQNANAIKDLDGLARSCSQLLKTLDPIKTELGTESRNLETLADAFKKSADSVKTQDIPKEKPKKETKKVPEKEVKKTPVKEKPEKAPENKPAPQNNSGSTGGEKTVVKGYVADGKGKITLTETTDKNGNVTKVTYTTTDEKGNVTEIKNYGPDGKLMPNAAAAAAAAAAAQQAAKTAAQEAAKSASRPPAVRVMPGGCTCP